MTYSSFRYVLIELDRLKALLALCTTCHKVVPNVILRYQGTMVRATQTCLQCGEVAWNSQAYMNRFCRGNIDVASGMLFSGTGCPACYMQWR